MTAAPGAPHPTTTSVSRGLEPPGLPVAIPPFPTDLLAIPYAILAYRPGTLLALAPNRPAGELLAATGVSHGLEPKTRRRPLSAPAMATFAYPRGSAPAPHDPALIRGGEAPRQTAGTEFPLLLEKVWHESFRVSSPLRFPIRCTYYTGSCKVCIRCTSSHGVRETRRDRTIT